MSDDKDPEAETPESLEMVFAEFGPRLVIHARAKLAEYRIPDSEISAEDLAQSAFTKVLEIDEETVSAKRTYLRRIVANEAAAIARHRGRRQCEARTPVAEEAASVPDIAAQIVNRQAVLKYLDQLPVGQREAVWANKALDYSQAETAELLQKAPGTVAVQVSRATRFLRANLTLAYIGILTCMAALLLDGVRRVSPASPSGGHPPGTGWEDTPLYRFLDALSWPAVVIALGALLGVEMPRRGWWPHQLVQQLRSRNRQYWREVRRQLHLFWEQLRRQLQGFWAEGRSVFLGFWIEVRKIWRNLRMLLGRQVAPPEPVRNRDGKPAQEVRERSARESRSAQQTVTVGNGAVVAGADLEGGVLGPLDNTTVAASKADLGIEATLTAAGSVEEAQPLRGHKATRLQPAYAPPQCPECSRPLPEPSGTGRPSTYCSAQCAREARKRSKVSG